MRIRLSTWNIVTFTGKSVELVDTMRRLRVNVFYLQEIKWEGHKAKEFADSYTLYNTRKSNGRNGVGIVIVLQRI